MKHKLFVGKVDLRKIYCSNALQTFNTYLLSRSRNNIDCDVNIHFVAFQELYSAVNRFWKSANLQIFAPKMFFFTIEWKQAFVGCSVYYGINETEKYIPQKHKHQRVKYPLLEKPHEQLLQFSLKAVWKQADLHWTLYNL